LPKLGLERQSCAAARGAVGAGCESGCHDRSLIVNTKRPCPVQIGHRSRGSVRALVDGQPRQIVGELTDLRSSRRRIQAWRSRRRAALPVRPRRK
jgi:hypothetical protein